MDKQGFTTTLRSLLFASLTGREGDVSGQPTGDVPAMLTAAYGPGPRGGVHTRAAAADLGVSQRTVQRWVAGEGHQRNRPAPEHLRTLARKARQAATTQ